MCNNDVHNAQFKVIHDNDPKQRLAHSKTFNFQFNVYHWSHTKLFLIDFIPKISSALAVTTWHSGQVQKEAYLKEKSINPFLTNVG